MWRKDRVVIDGTGQRARGRCGGRKWYGSEVTGKEGF